MTDDQKPRTTSGELPAVIFLRKKMDSIDEITLPEATRTIERIDVALANTSPPTGMTQPPAPAAPLAGRYRIALEAAGKHHNRLPEDADLLFARFVRALRAAGHDVSHASFTNGDEQIITDPETYLAERDAEPK